MKVSNETQKTLYGLGIIATGFAVKKIAEKTWQVTKGSNPPEDPSKSSTSTKDMLLWTVGVAVLGGIGQVFYKKWVPNPANN